HIDDDGPLGIADQPDKVVHRHRAVVRIATDEVAAARALAGRILDGIDFVEGRAHGRWIARASMRTPERYRPDGSVFAALPAKKSCSSGEVLGALASTLRRRRWATASRRHKIRRPDRPAAARSRRSPPAGRSGPPAAHR